MLHNLRRVFQSKPMLANMVTYGTMYTVAEASQQKLMQFSDHPAQRNKNIDWNVIGRYGVISVGILGPTLFYWYRALDTSLPSKSFGALVAKVMVDQVVAGAGSISVFFLGMSILEGKEDIFAELKAKFLSTYAMSCCFWLPAQAVNFALLPPYTRVAFVGAASFVWVNVLCLIKRQEIPDEPLKANLSVTVPTDKLVTE